MNILVCVKPVPDPEKYSELRIDEKTKRLIREGIPSVINSTDRNALEAALVLRESMGGSVSVLTMAPEFSRDKVVESLAMGADEGFLVSDAAYGGADTYATSYVLAAAVEEIEKSKGFAFDLILAGNESADGATAHVPTQLAEWLKRPHLCNVRRLEVNDEGSITAEKKTSDGTIGFAGKLPAVIAVSRDINKPRFVTAMGIIKARKKPLTVMSNEQLGLDASCIGLAGSPTQAGALITPDMSRKAEAIDGDADEAAARILEIIRSAGI